MVALDGTKMRAVASPKNIAGAERLARDVAHTEKEIAYVKPYARTAVRQAVHAMTEHGTLLPVTVEGLPEVYMVQPDHLEQILTAPLDAVPAATTVYLLSPFDNLVIQRQRLQQLFNFPAPFKFQLTVSTKPLVVIRW